MKDGIIDAIVVLLGLFGILIFLHSCDVENTKRTEVEKHTVTEKK